MDTYYFINIMKVIRIIRIIRIGKIVATFNYMFLERKYGETDNDNYGEENENIILCFNNHSPSYFFS